MFGGAAVAGGAATGGAATGGAPDVDASAGGDAFATAPLPDDALHMATDKLTTTTSATQPAAMTSTVDMPPDEWLLPAGIGGGAEATRPAVPNTSPATLRAAVQFFPSKETGVSAATRPDCAKAFSCAEVAGPCTLPFSRTYQLCAMPLTPM